MEIYCRYADTAVGPVSEVRFLQFDAEILVDGVIPRLGGADRLFSFARPGEFAEYESAILAREATPQYAQMRPAATKILPRWK